MPGGANVRCSAYRAVNVRKSKPPHSVEASCPSTDVGACMIGSASSIGAMDVGAMTTRDPDCLGSDVVVGARAALLSSLLFDTS